jgi:hypothetical protein
MINVVGGNRKPKAPRRAGVKGETEEREQQERKEPENSKSRGQN